MDMSVARRPEIFIFITGVVMGLTLFGYFFDISEVQNAVQTFQTWATGIGWFALALGFLTAARVHLNYIRRRTPGRWYFSAWLFILTFIVTVAGLISQSTGFYKWSFTWVYTPLDATLYATTGFYIFSAAYRAFRARNLEASILLIAGILVMLGNCTVGEVIWNQIPAINEWLQLNGETPAMRALLFTAAFGLILFGIRVLMGAEKRFLGVVEGGGG